MSAKRRSYSVEFKQEAVRLVREQGMTCAQVGTDLGICKSVIRDWVLRSRQQPQESQAVNGSASPGSLEEEVKRLRRENAVLREEREILKKAAAFFAKESR